MKRLNKQIKYKAIVIGTSAGGFQALCAIFKNLTSTYPAPIVVVQHRSKNRQNDLLENILQGKCEIKVKQADEKEKIESGFVYLAPPDYHLLIESDETFSLSADEPVHFSRPSIDVLFETAATVYKDRLVAILLTGASDDGAGGIGIVKKYGGLTIAQDPDGAQFSFMPASAIKTKNIERVLSLQEIENFLLQISTS